MDWTSLKYLLFFVFLESIYCDEDLKLLKRIREDHSAHFDSSPELHAAYKLLVRHRRSLRVSRALEGAPCRMDDPDLKCERGEVCDACTKDYKFLKCNQTTGQCICDPEESGRLALLPGFFFCVPMVFVTDTFRCLPTKPDVCDLAFPGSKCVFDDTGNDQTWRCRCAAGGQLNNCRKFIGMSCAGTNKENICEPEDTEPGQKVPGCHGISKTCECLDNTVQSGDLYSCRAETCPGPSDRSSPCRGPFGEHQCFKPGSDGYVPGSGKYYCKCLNLGINHSEYQNGICCEQGVIPCSDYSRCIESEQICDGVSDCEDCSDEEYTFCQGDLPSKPQCSRFGSSQSNLFGRISTANGKSTNLLPLKSLLITEENKPVSRLESRKIDGKN